MSLIITHNNLSDDTSAFFLLTSKELVSIFLTFGITSVVSPFSSVCVCL